MSVLAVVDWNGILQPPGLPVLLLIVTLGAFGMAAVIAPQARRMMDARLKEKMVDRGFSAGEIRTVIEAGHRPGRVGERHGRRKFLNPGGC